jgi:hypothetical protein
MGLDTKTYRLTDRQSQCDFDFDFDSVAVMIEPVMSEQWWLNPLWVSSDDWTRYEWAVRIEPVMSEQWGLNPLWVSIEPVARERVASQLQFGIRRSEWKQQK